MKKTYLFLALLVSVVFANAQVFNLYYEDEPFSNELTVALDPTSGLAMTFIYMENTTAEDVTFRIHKNITQIPTGNSMLMCFGENCLDTDISGFQTVAAGEMFTHFDVLYTFSNEVNASAIFTILDADSNALQTFTLNYVNEESLINDVKDVPLHLTAAPIPASTNTTISYSIPEKYTSARIIVKNTLGSVVKAMNVPTGKSGKVNMDVSNLNSGVYFYSIIADGQTLSTKKLVVKH